MKRSPQAAQGPIREWIAEVKHSGFDCFDKFITALEESMGIITNYFTRRSDGGSRRGNEQQDQGAQAPLLLDRQSDQSLPPRLVGFLRL
jgi:hypothetical protein